MTAKTIKTNKMQIRASIVPETANMDEREIEVVFSTGSKGKRATIFETYFEELSMQKSHVRLDRFNNGAPVLNNHQSMRLEDNLGIITRAWIKDRLGYATVKLSGREEVRGLVNDILEGTIRNISVGYLVHEYKDVSKKGDEIPTFRAVDWEPMELSFVNIPFDMDAQSRSNNENEVYNTKITREMESESMDTPENTTETTNETVDNTVETTEAMPEANTETVENETTIERSVDLDGQVDENDNVETRSETTNEEPALNKEEIIKEERERCESIKVAVRSAGLDAELAEQLIKDEKTVDEARELVLKKLEERSESTVTNNHNVEVNDVDNRQLRIDAATNALLHRSSDGKVELKDGAKEYRGLSLIRMAERFLKDQNIDVNGMANHQIAERALHHSSDFVEVLANTANKTLRAGYDEQPQTFEFMTRSVEVSDFKEISRTQLSDAPALEKVNENGEIKHGKMSDAAEKYRVESYGKIVGISRQTLMNDDLDAFSRVPGLMGASARDLETFLIYAELASNPIMSDGNALFSAAHGNLAAGGDVGAPGVATVSAGRLAMRLQKGLTDKLIRITPEYILNPAALETTVEQFLGPIMPNQDSQINPFKGKLMGVTEAELDAYSATGWYMMAAKSRIDMFEIARLIGETGPRISSRMGFEKQGVQLKVEYDFGVKAIDWRGMYFNPGA